MKTLEPPAPAPAQGGLTPQVPSPVPRASLFWSLLWGGFGGCCKAASEYPVVVWGERWVLQSSAGVACGGVGSGVFPLAGVLLHTGSGTRRGAPRGEQSGGL